MIAIIVDRLVQQLVAHPASSPANSARPRRWVRTLRMADEWRIPAPF
jgi:hypothetical protein